MQIEGRNPVLESLHSKREFERIKIQEGINVDMKVKRILDLARAKKIYIEEVPKKKLDQMSETGVHQGIIAIGREKRSKNFDELLKMIQERGEEPFLIYIREVLYEHNLGAIIRTAECAGVHGVIVPPGTDISAQVIRASMGASEHVQIVHGSLFQVIKEAQKNAIKTVGIEITGTHSLYETDLRGAVMIVVGGEDRGLSEEITKKLDEVVKIPMSGKVNSLNMSVAGAIAIYEKVRQSSM